MTDSIYNNAGMPSEQKGIQMSDGIDDGGRGESWSRDGKGDLVNDSTGEPFLPSVAEQVAAPEIPEDLRGLYEFSKLDTTTFVGSQIRQLIGRIAALTLERDTLKAERDEVERKGQQLCSAYGLSLITIHDLEAKVERLSAPVSGDVATLLCNLAQILDVVKIEWAESWSEWDQQQREAITAFLTAYYARASTPPTPLVFTCPFDGEIWRFHMQEQLDMLQKHMDWHGCRKLMLGSNPTTAPLP